MDRPRGSRTDRQLAGLAAFLVTVAALLLLLSIGFKVQEPADPAWIGLGLVGLCLLLMAVAVATLRP